LGHDIHFLRRLERASAAQVERALQLYRDPEAVRFVLDRARLPDGADRIALSMDVADQGPFVIIERKTWRFVTCLAKGMTTDLPLIEWERLEALLVRLDQHRDRQKSADELLHQGAITPLIKRLLTRGAYVSREDIEHVAMLGPLIRGPLLLRVLDLLESTLEAHPRLQRLKRTHSRAARAGLQRFYRNVHGIGHLMTIFSMGGSEGLEDILEKMVESDTTLTYSLFYHGELTLAYRGIFCAGKIGRSILPLYKRGLRDAGHFVDALESLTALLVLALRNRKLSAEIRKVFDSLQRTHSDAAAHLTNQNENWPLLLNTALQEPEKLAALYRKNCRQELFNLCQGRPGPPLDFDSPDDVPDDLALAANFSRCGDFMNNGPLLLDIIQSATCLAHLEAPALYLPQAALDRLDTRAPPHESLNLATRHRRFYGTPEPAKKAPKPGRNAPCPCGSNKKYKRCCLNNPSCL
jgi:SEC-C motif